MSLWWLQPGWADACCARCGTRIAPDGDPDWGYCYACFTDNLNARQSTQHLPRCDICGIGAACAASNGYAVCSQQCDEEATKRMTAPTEGSKP